MKEIIKILNVTSSFIQVEETDRNKNDIKWADILKVMVESNDLGSFENDLNLILFTIKDKIVIPMNLDNFKDFLEFLQKSLPGFDNNEFIKAMSSHGNALFEIWNKH